MGKGVSCLGIGKRKVRGGLSVKERREERGKKKLVILELERAKKNQRERKKEFLRENLEEGDGLSFGSLIS